MLKINYLNPSWGYFLLLLFPVFYFIHNSDLITYMGASYLHLAILLVLAVGAFIEEFIFRYFLPEVFGSGVTSLFFYSVCFSLSHLANEHFSFYSFINTLLISMVLYDIRYKLGFVFAVIFHFIWNATIVIIFGGVISGIDINRFIVDSFEIQVSSSILIGSYGSETYGIESSWSLTLLLLIVCSSLLSLNKLGGRCLIKGSE